MSNEELRKILEDHLHWLKRDCFDWKNMRADLHGEDLREADLREVNLQGAYLYEVDLREADLSGANLCDTILREANLCDANLSKAYLCRTDLREADLQGASIYKANLSNVDLQGANLRRVDLREANLDGVNLQVTDLRGAYLCDAYLYRADLYGANLRGADIYMSHLHEAKNIPYIPMVCPEEGSFIGWKKCQEGLIVKLEIPEDALRSSATSRKCRCDKARVLAIYNLDGTVANKTEAVSYYDDNFIYRVGEIVTVDDFDGDRWCECSAGIHFFINRQEAINYNN